MAETHKSWADVLAALADNTASNLSARDFRDALYSWRQIWGGLSVTGGTTATTLTNASTWYQLDLADFTNDAASVGVSPDKASDRIVLPAVAGVYWVFAGLNCKPSANGNDYAFKFQLDGNDIAGAVDAAGWRNPASAIGQGVSFSFPVRFTSGNGYLTLHASTPVASGLTLTLTGGGIWVFRVA